jgi:hypothetical protein
MKMTAFWVTAFQRCFTASETSVNFCETARGNIPEGCRFQLLFCAEYQTMDEVRKHVARLMTVRNVLNCKLLCFHILEEKSRLVDLEMSVFFLCKMAFRPCFRYTVV